MNPEPTAAEEAADLVPLIERWIQSALRLDDTYGKLERAFMASPENEIRGAVWGMFDEYTQTLAELLSDDPADAQEWLEWYAWECDFGRKPKKMEFSDGEALLVVGPSDLLAAILAYEDGKRVL